MTAKKKATSKAVARAGEREAKTPAQQLAQSIQQMAGQFESTLPSGVPLDRFMRVTLTAIQNSPDLLQADRRSLYYACHRAAQDGLMPDGREGAIVTFGGKAQFMPMVYGRRKQAGRSGIRIDAQVVYEHDHFEYKLGDDPTIEHEPVQLGGERGEIIGAYARAILPDGTIIREVMHRDEIERARAASRSGGKGPWKDWFSEMAKKTVIHRLAKALPDDDLLASVQRENIDLYGDADGTIIDDPEAGKTSVHRPSAIQGAIDDAEDTPEGAPEGEPPADDDSAEDDEEPPL